MEQKANQKMQEMEERTNQKIHKRQQTDEQINRKLQEAMQTLQGLKTEIDSLKKHNLKKGRKQKSWTNSQALPIQALPTEQKRWKRESQVLKIHQEKWIYQPKKTLNPTNP